MVAKMLNCSVSVAWALATMTLIAHEAWAQTTSVNQQALDAITNTADHICVTVRAEGTSQRANADISAQIGGLARILSGMGIAAGGGYDIDRYTGFLQGDLPSVAADTNRCKQHVFDTLVGLMLVDRPKMGQQTCEKRTETREGPIDTTNWLITKNPTLHLDVPDNEKIVHAYVVTQHEINGSVNVSQVTITPDGKHATAICSVNGPGGGHTNSVGECFIRASVEVGCN
jgi:hypothetical protein